MELTMGVERFELPVDTDVVVQVTGLTDDDGATTIDDATVTMSLFEEAKRQRVQILVPNTTASAGTWTLTYQGEETANIDYDASLYDIQAALDLLDAVVEGDILVTGTTIDAGTGGLAFEFAETFGDVPAITFDFSSLTGPTNAASAITKKTKNLFKGAAVDKGGGSVGLPVIKNDVGSSTYIRIEGTKNYDGEYSATATEDEVIITATYVAETFAGDGRETLYIGIGNGTNISLPADGESTGGYEGTLPNNLKGLVKRRFVGTSLGQIEIGIYPLFITIIDTGPDPDVKKTIEMLGVAE